MVAVPCPECGAESEFHSDGEGEYLGCEHVIPHGKYVRAGRRCHHPKVTDHELEEREERIYRSWGNADPLSCPDCGEQLFLDHASDAVVTTPPGDGADVSSEAGRIW